MIKKKRRNNGLAGIAERYAISLIYESTSGKIGRGTLPSKENMDNAVPFKERRALLDSITKLLAAQKEGNEEDESNGLSSFMERLKDGGDGGEVEGGADSPTPGEDDIYASDGETVSDTSFS